MHMGDRLKVRLLIAAAISAMAVSPTASAQSARRMHYDLPMDALADSLRAVSRLSGREIIFTGDGIEGRTAPRLKGDYTPDDAVRQLLKGSGFSAEFRKDVILIRRKPHSFNLEAGGPEDNAEIVVTGSHIRGKMPIAPLVARSRDDIERRGRTDLGAFARDLPQSYSGGQNPGVIGSFQPGSENFNSSSTLNLRGLGADATLTLLNGHRVAYDSVVQGVDISAIPLIAVERVEVVTDGSSALYGADAVAGVANILLRRDYDGLQTTAHLAAANDGGAEQQQYSAIAGRRWTSGGMFIAGDLTRSTAVTAKQRELTSGLNGASILYPRIHSVTSALAAHQNLSDIAELSIDGHYSNRDSTTAYAFLTTADYRTSGNYGDRNVEAWSISPRLRLKLNGGWEIDLFGTLGSSNSTTWASSFSGGRLLVQNEIHYDNDLRNIEASADGPLFHLPAGPVVVALGGGYREIALSANIRAHRATSTTTTLAFDTTQKISYAYGELSMPAFKAERDRAFLERVDLTAAARYERYAGIASTWTPKFGALIGFGGGISLGTSWGKSFKAPTLSQVSRATTGDLVSAGDFLPAAPGGLPILLLGGTKPGVGPETATSWNATLSIKPPFLHGLGLQLTYYEVTYKNRVMEPFASTTDAFGSNVYSDLIITSPTAAQINAIVQSLPLGLTNQTSGAFDPANVGAIVDNRLQNIARQELKSVDLAVSYIGQLGEDRVEITGNASYLENRLQLSALQPTIERSGVIFSPPHWRGAASGSWFHRGASITATLNYIGGTADRRFAPATRVGSFTTVDLVARLESGEERGLFKGSSLTIGVTNLLNSYPDRIRNASAVLPPFDATNYSIIGRVVSLSLSKRW
jgi:outer membrane receptor protein involved in Fe transport